MPTLEMRWRLASICLFSLAMVCSLASPLSCSQAYLSIIQQIAVLFPDLSERQQQSITREQQVWQQVISRAVECGEVQPAIDTELMAQTFIALFYGRAYRDSLIVYPGFL